MFKVYKTNSEKSDYDLIIIVENEFHDKYNDNLVEYRKEFGVSQQKDFNHVRSNMRTQWILN